MRFSILFFLLFSIDSFAQPQMPSAHAQAMGGSFATQHSVFSSFYNVAGLSFLQKNEIAIGARNNFLVNSLNDIYIAAAVVQDKSTVAFDGQLYGFDAYQEIHLGGSYALQFSEKWSAGVRINFGYNSIPQESVTRHFIGADLGALGHFANWRVGFSLKNLLQSQWMGRVKEAAPRSITLGGGYFFQNKSSITADVVVSDQLPTDLRIGANYFLTEKVDFRIGFTTIQPAFNAGLGLDLKNFRLNIAVAWHQQLGISPLIDGSYAW